MANGDFQSSEILFEIVKSEYQNEFNRTSVIDTKVGITLPIIATYFFLALQFKSMKQIFTTRVNIQTVATTLFSICNPLIYIATIVCAAIALIYLFRAIITQSYQAVDPRSFNDKESLYKRGWIFAMISLGLFVCYICLNQ